MPGYYVYPAKTNTGEYSSSALNSAFVMPFYCMLQNISEMLERFQAVSHLHATYSLYVGFKYVKHWKVGYNWI